MRTFQHILVPTDFSAAAEKAIEMARSIGSKFAAKLTLLHVIPTPPFYGYEPTRDWPLPIEELPREAQRVLDDALRKLEGSYPRVEGTLVSGDPSEQILMAANERRVDLIVMGTHGRRGLSHVLLGSVAEKVVRASPVPVLTVGARGSSK